MSNRGDSRKRGADEISADCSTSMDPWATTTFTWRVENFSKLSREIVFSDFFEAGICTWRLQVWPEGEGDDLGTHLSVYLEAQDVMWAASAQSTLTVVNQADASKSCSGGSAGNPDVYNKDCCVWGQTNFVKLSALRGASSGWLVNDTLMLKVDVIVEREDRFQLDMGGMPCDVVLKLPCGAEVPTISLFLQTASTFFRGALEDVEGGAAIPVDGSLGTWTYILIDLYPLHDPPALTLGSVYTLLPVVHNFTKLLTRLVAFVKDNIEDLPQSSCISAKYIIYWLSLAERLQLDELHELVLDRLRGLTREQLRKATTAEVEVESGAGAQTRRVVREEVKRLGQALCCELFAISMQE
ncbi:hypothetical protein FOA52_013566 [Chlamydomonas sp. UWO 241]|nr:hypothetical protein FOA52_013566 [Chlamydomonas sp. UWO 241]